MRHRKQGESPDRSGDSPCFAKAAFVPGQVWWCDGIALAFDPYYKRRPVLIVDVEADTLYIIPLSSKRRYGQEPAVTHERGVSYMAGPIRPICSTALLQPLGSWAGFTEWQNPAPDTPDANPPLLQRILKRVRAWFGKPS